VPLWALKYITKTKAWLIGDERTQGWYYKRNVLTRGPIIAEVSSKYLAIFNQPGHLGGIPSAKVQLVHVACVGRSRFGSMVVVNAFPPTSWCICGLGPFQDWPVYKKHKRISAALRINPVDNKLRAREAKHRVQRRSKRQCDSGSPMHGGRFLLRI